VAQTLNASVGPVGGVLMMTGHERWVLANTVLLGGLNAIGNYLLVPEYGIIGAAISTAGAVICWNLVSLLEVYLLLGIQPYTAAYLRVLGAGALAFGAALAILALLPSWGGWVACPAGLGVYLIAYRAFAFEPEDRELVEIIRTKMGRA
jgi:O-antigen/teichoic acid export membrane protein